MIKCQKYYIILDDLLVSTARSTRLDACQVNALSSSLIPNLFEKRVVFIAHGV